jgi:hypothetical protein
MKKDEKRGIICSPEMQRRITDGTTCDTEFKADP